MLNESLISGFGEILDRDYGDKFPKNEIVNIANNLVSLFETLRRIESKTKNEYEYTGSTD
jgi:hypothetical protein